MKSKIVNIQIDFEYKHLNVSKRRIDAQNYILKGALTGNSVYTHLSIHNGRWTQVGEVEQGTYSLTRGGEGGAGCHIAGRGHHIARRALYVPCMYM